MGMSHGSQGCLSEPSVGEGHPQSSTVMLGLSPSRLTPIYFSTGVLWVLIAAATLGLLHFFLSHYVGLNVLRLIAA